MVALFAFLGVLSFFVVCGIVFYQLVEHEDFFYAHEAYTDGRKDARYYTYTPQSNPWIRFWYNRGFSRTKYLTSDAVVARKKKRAEASEDRTIARAKRKGWIE